MTVRLAAWILLGTASLIQTIEVSSPISLTVVKLGDNATLYCKSEKAFNSLTWYKQPLGHMFHEVASRFGIVEEKSQNLLIIPNVTKEDEATYYCQTGTRLSHTFVNGTFLAVIEYNQQESVNFKQSPNADLVEPRDTVALQCPLCRKKKESGARCHGEHSVYWLRGGLEGFHPGILYTQRNISNEDMEKGCSYSLSRDKLSDAATFYCAVVTCGRIMFSGETRVEKKPELDPVVIVLGGLLVTCSVTLTVLCVFYVKQKKVCSHCKEHNIGHHRSGHDISSGESSNDLDGRANEVNYGSVEFQVRRSKRGKKKKEKNKELQQECVYSVVKLNHHQQQQSSDSICLSL
ncbi:uncharacterized protein ACNS7B_012048 [Menidia menidia]